jgi:hypothetical protein
MDVCLCFSVLSCVGRGLGAGLIPRPRSPTKCLKDPYVKRKNPTPEKGIRNNEKEEEESLFQSKSYDLISRCSILK